MERPFSTSKVTVEYFDPHGLYNLIGPGLASRLPLRHLHWQSHSGPLRSIDTLHVELVAAGSNPSSTPAQRDSNAASGDDGFQTASIGGRGGSSENVDAASSSSTRPATKERRHQIPGLRQTPYLKVLLVRCDDNDSYKSHTRSEIREWVKQNAMQGGKKSTVAENHDAYEWMLIHVVIPNSTAYSQPRLSKSTDGSATDITLKSASRWGKSTSTILEKLRSDFNGSNSSSKTGIDRVVQIRVALGDVPYDLLPLVSPAHPGGYTETEHEAQNAWIDLVDKLKTLILSSFDVRVFQYEEDMREKETQRSLPGWNFCTFFILKEGLARGFESVGLVEDALVGYDELSIGLDTIIKEQQAAQSAAETRSGALLSYTEDLKRVALGLLSTIDAGSAEVASDDEPIDLQSTSGAGATGGAMNRFDNIPISSTKKPYRDLILANNVSAFDFRCYIFARQVSLLLRMGNAWSTREELLAKLKEQQDAVLYRTDPPQSQPPKSGEESENLSMLAEICRRTLEFIPTVSRVMREDVLQSIACARRKAAGAEAENDIQEAFSLTPGMIEVVDNMVASLAFSIVHQILAQTATKSLSIPPSTMATTDIHEPKASIPELKTMMHPARSSSLHVGNPTRGPASPGIFPGPGQPTRQDTEGSRFSKMGLEELAARRADLFALSRNILVDAGCKRSWPDGWSSAPIMSELGLEYLEDVDLNDESSRDADGKTSQQPSSETIKYSLIGIKNALLYTALDNKDDFYRLYETLTDKALRHYTVAGQNHSVHSNLADLAVLKFHLGDFSSAASYFYETTPFIGENGWSLLELSMLVMYSRCLRELGRMDEYVWRLVKLLSKAAQAEKDRVEQQSSLGVDSARQHRFVSLSTVRGYLGDLLEASRGLADAVRVPLTNFFRIFELDGAPVYVEKQDSFSVTVRFYSLLADELPVDRIKLRLVCHHSGGPPREIWLESREQLHLRPRGGKFQLFSNTVIPGIYEMNQVVITSSNLVIIHDPATTQQPRTSDAILKEPYVILYQRASALDVRLSTSKDLQLDKNNFLEVELFSGWNEISQCELRIRAATGGLRLITSEAQVVQSSPQLSKPVEGGVINFGSIPAETCVKVAFPFSIEQDVLDLCVKIDVVYKTNNGTFCFAKSPSISTALALGVNVQDVFKHNALFSRFTVSTATASPLRLFKSELIQSDIFTSHFGVPPESPTIIFSKQPASLLYKIVKRSGSQVGSGTQKMMYIKLYYSVLQDEIDTELELSITQAFQSASAPLREFSRAVTACALRHLHAAMNTTDLEKVVLLGELSTSLFGELDWKREFPGLGFDSSDKDVAEQLSLFMSQWQSRHCNIPIPPTDLTTTGIRTILIPVDVPSITIVHTANILFQEPLNGNPTASISDGSIIPRPSTLSPNVCVNQLLPATLHLKWTRVWDTVGAGTEAGERGTHLASEDLEFSFEVTAPTDTWLIGGRRKGHFVIPAAGSGDGIGLTSSPETEAMIPLILIPLREGNLPYPNVEIREVIVVAGEAGNGADQLLVAESQQAQYQNRHHCETDYRNLGETVGVVADRERVTLSLDASGPGGGPLVLGSERSNVVGRLVV